MPTPINSSERVDRLNSLISSLWEQYDLETRVEERARLKAVIKVHQIELDQILASPNPTIIKPKIYSDRLPTVKGKFFGRKAELKLLDDAWEGNGTRIIQFIAAGGTGKTKLIRHWLDLTAPEHVIAWSFYSQGSSEDKQTSAIPFFSHVFEVLKAEKRLETDFISPEAKGEYLAGLLNQQRCVLVLDGLEPMQYADKANRGELKDRALRTLLKNLVGSGTGLCVVTTRISVHELSDRAPMINHDLHNLTLDDGVQLLESLGVKGCKDELEQAVKDYGCHALALSLLGNLLRIRYQGDVHKRLTLKNLVTTSKTKENQHAFKVMQAYAEYFDGQTELALLSLLGLFDHPIEIEVLRVLWAAQIPALTAGIDEGEWWDAIEVLRHEYQLLAERVGSDELDCHPLIREYFGKRLEDESPDVWRQVHACLYEYYKNLPEKEFPDTLEEMQPLFHAVAHGCRAGLHQQTYDEVYWGKIAANESYIWYHLGGYSDDLAVVSSFFSHLWLCPDQRLDEYSRATVANRASYCLGLLGRSEAEDILIFTIDAYEISGDSEGAAIALSNLVHFYIDRGRLFDAQKFIEKYTKLIEKTTLSGFIAYKCVAACLMHQFGFIDLSIYLFNQSEKAQKDAQGFPYLYASQGFLYIDLLIDCGTEKNNLFNRVYYGLNISDKAQLGDFSKSLYLLSLGVLYRRNKKFRKSIVNLEQGFEYIKKSNCISYMCRFYLEISKVYGSSLNPYRDNNIAYYNLRQLHDLAKNHKLMLMMGDYHLEMARLLIAEGKAPTSEVKEHVDQAEKLINDTGYHRRDKELADLKDNLKALL